MVPTTYELNEDGEATGIVYHYCSPECQGKHRHELIHFQEVDESDDVWTDMCDGEVCAYCEAALQE